MPQIHHEKLNVTATLNDFSQAQYEKYQTVLVNIPTEREKIAMAVADGTVVRAAIDAGILTGVEAEKVGDMPPAVVKWLTRKIHFHVEEIVTVPPE